MALPKKRHVFHADPFKKKTFVNQFEENKLHYEFFDQFETDSGDIICNFRLAYRVFGRPNDEMSNIIFVFHALTGDANCGGYLDKDGYNQGWWEDLFGEGKILDRQKYCIIAPNHPGGCYGSTGPTDHLVGDNTPIGPDFPLLSVRDIAKAHQKLLEKLGIRKIHSVIGGSFGGMVVSEFITLFPDIADHAVMIAAPISHSAQALAMNHIQRRCIENDPNFNQGRYYDGIPPKQGLSLARQLGMITYRNPLEFDQRFGRNKQDVDYEKNTYFEIQSYLDHQGRKLINRFDANSYIQLTHSMDAHDISHGSGDYNSAVRRIKARLLLIAVDSDVLYPPIEMESFQNFCVNNGVNATYAMIKSLHGHDGFLIEYQQLNEIIDNWLLEEKEERKCRKVVSL